MARLRRLIVSVGIAVSIIAAATVVSVGATTGFGAGAGIFTFSDTSAFVSAFNPSDQSSLNLNVDRGTFMFGPRPNGALQTATMTVLSITQVFPNPDPTQPPTFNSTCLVIPDTDFAVSSDLQTARLNALDQSTLCPDFIVAVTGAVVDQKPGGGGGSTIPLPISATVTWTGDGAVGVSEDNGTFRCLTFDAITHNHSQQSLSSNVTGQITANNSPFASFSGGQSSGVFGTDSINTSVQNVAGLGILPPACGGKGG
jgi:hypothetical protein